MKIVNEQAAQATVAPSQKLQDAGHGRVWVWDKQTGEPKALYSVDATELLDKYADRFSATPVSKQQVEAEDAVIIDNGAAQSEPEVSAKEPEPTAPAVDTATDNEPNAWPTQDEASAKRSRSRRKSNTDND